MYEFTIKSLRDLADRMVENEIDAVHISVSGKMILASHLRTGKQITVYGREAYLTGSLIQVYNGRD